MRESGSEEELSSEEELGDGEASDELAEEEEGQVINKTQDDDVRRGRAVQNQISKYWVVLLALLPWLNNSNLHSHALFLLIHTSQCIRVIGFLRLNPFSIAVSAYPTQNWDQKVRF